ncbi:MAG: hypothetical protein ABF619_03315 [Oenococcus oeni]
MKLEQQKTIFISAYLTTGKVADSANKAGIRRETAYSWLNNDPAIQGIVQESQEAIYMQAMNKLTQKVSAASDYLVSLLDDENASPKDKLAAVKMILEQADKISEFNRANIQARQQPEDPAKMFDTLVEKNQDKQSVEDLLSRLDKLESAGKSNSPA